MSMFIVTIQRKDQLLLREVSKESFTVGRSLDCDIHLNDHHVSRTHMVVSRRRNEIWIDDKNSSNGTFVNGAKIPSGKPFLVAPGDAITMGRSEYVLKIEVKAMEAEPPLRSEVPPRFEPPVSDKTEEIPLPAVSPSSPVISQHADKGIHEAKKKAAQIILEGETQAEKRAQAIYQKARETQEKAEHFYQARIAEAHKQADAILADFQKQGQELLHEARNMAQELREEVDAYIQSLREKAKKESEELISEANRAAEKIKAEARDQGMNRAQKEAESLVKEARDEAARVIGVAQLQSAETKENIKTETETLRQLTEDVAKSLAKLNASQASLEACEKRQAELTERSKYEEARIGQLIKDEEEKISELQIAQKNLSAQKKNIEQALSDLQEKQVQVTMDIRDLDLQRVQLLREYEAQKIILNEKIEKEKSQMASATEERVEEMRLELSKKLQKMEQDLLDDVIQKKVSLGKEIYVSVEKEILKLMETSQWRKVSSTVEKNIHEAIEGKIATLSQSTASSVKPVDLMKKRTSEKLRWATGGLAVGALAFFVSEIVLEKVRKDQTPMQTRVLDEAKKRQEELERRRFNPPQVAEVKETYVDSVIYTQKFVEIYADQDYQNRLYKAMSVYLLKTWRVDEEKALQVLAAANALIKELVMKKAAIHPDFVKAGLEKMHGLEKETLTRMKNILGSEVRLESFRRFERNFFKEEAQRRRMAQQ